MMDFFFIVHLMDFFFVVKMYDGILISIKDQAIRRR